MKFLTHKQGVSFDRVVGYETCSEPTQVDKERVAAVLKGAQNAGSGLAYKAGLVIERKLVELVASRVGLGGTGDDDQATAANAT